MTEPTMAEKTQLPPKISLAEAARNVRDAQSDLDVAAHLRGKASQALRKADLELVQAKHALALAERRVVLSALFENQPPPIPKTREEMAAFATAWDAKVEANNAAQALDILDAAGVKSADQFDALVAVQKLNTTGATK